MASRAYPLLLLYLLAACQRDIELTIEQAPTATYATASAGPDAPPPCVKHLYVREGQKTDQPPLWHIASAPSDPCTSRFRLGDVPPGFAADDGAAPLRLRAGQTYTVTASGSGFSASATFTKSP